MDWAAIGAQASAIFSPALHPCVARCGPSVHSNMAASLSQGLTAILTTAGASDDKFRQFLVDHEITQPDGLGLLASTETALEEKVFPMLKAVGVATERLATLIAIKKAWHLSRNQVDKESAISSGKQPAQSPNEPLAQPTRTSITDAWKKRHSFTWPNDRLLSEPLIGQIYRELNGTPRKMSIFLAEGLRLQSAINTSNKTFATIRDGYIGTEEVIADQVTNVLELYTRIRAFFGTVAFCMIHEPERFALQDIIFIEDKMLSMLQMTKEGKRPPLVHFTTAWATTNQTWSDEVRTSGKSLAILVKETATWTPAWLSWAPPTSDAHSGHRPDYTAVTATGTGSAKERELQEQLDKTRKWAAEMQSQRDRLQKDSRHATASDPRSQRSRSRGRDRGARDGRGGAPRQDWRAASSKKGARSKAHGGGKGGTPLTSF